MERELKEIGLTDNEVIVYLHLLKFGEKTVYQISQKTVIYRVHIYDIIEKLIQKGLVSFVNKGIKKYYKATHPNKIYDFIEEKNKKLDEEKKSIENIMPTLESAMLIPTVDTKVNVYEGKEGIKYILKDIIKTGCDVCITGIDDERYETELPIFMKQYFRDLRLNKIYEKVITNKKRGVFLFKKSLAPKTQYRFLEDKQFNPTNTFIYGNKIVIVTWGMPVTAIMIENKEITDTYKTNFEYLWKIADKKPF